MDFNLVIVIACVSFVSFVSLLLINKFFRRKTFDEVIAEKKAMIYGANPKKPARSSQNVKKEAKKDKKRQQKLLQQQQDSDGQQSETQSESAEATEMKPHIEFEPEPVILEEEPVQAAVLKQRKPKKTEKKQGILVNKNEIVVAKENDSASANQLNHFDVKPPKDVVELKKQVKETVIVKQAQQTHESPKNIPKKKTEKKKEKESQNIQEADIQGVNGLMKLFSKADLNRSETQILIEFLLNKQQDMPESHSSWSDDIVPKLRKELEQAQKELVEERTSTKSIQEKLQVLRNEFNVQKNKLADFNRKHNAELEIRNSEIADLKQEIVSLNEKFNVERQQFQVSLQHHREKANSSQDLLTQIQKLQAEVAQKSQVISELEQHLNVAKETTNQLNATIQSQVQQTATLEQRLRESESLSARLQEVEAEKETSKVEIRNLQNALDLTSKKLDDVSSVSTAGEEGLKKLKEELKNANEKLAQISTEKVQKDEKYSKLEKDHKDLAKQQDSYKEEIQKYKQIVSEKDAVINNFEKNSKQREEIILQQVAEQKDKNNPSGKKSSDEQKIRQLFERICPEAVKKHANSALSSPFDQWVEQVLTTHTELNKTTSASSRSNGDLSNNTNISNLSSKSSSKANGQNTEDLEKLTAENNNLKQEKAQLRAQNEELKKLVTNTENILKNIETKAQEQDANWKDVVRAKNEEIEILKHSNGHQ